MEHPPKRSRHSPGPCGRCLLDRDEPREAELRFATCEHGLCFWCARAGRFTAVCNICGTAHGWEPSGALPGLRSEAHGPVEEALSAQGATVLRRRSWTMAELLELLSTTLPPAMLHESRDQARDAYNACPRAVWLVLDDGRYVVCGGD